MNYENLKKILFKLPPETAHNLAEVVLSSVAISPKLQQKLAKTYLVEDETLTQTFFNKKFKNPVGIGAGFDKNGKMVKALHALGFGFVEVGTVTPRPQIGNPRPRLFRFVKEESLQNAMGFNNDGATVVKERIKKVYPTDFPLGINIGKNKDTPLEESLKDYHFLIEEFQDISDYLVINISSPNTPQLRKLQNRSFIQELFSKKTDVPILLKIAPDMEEKEAIDLCVSAIEAGASGIIATNTSTNYSLLPNPQPFGGISGRVLKEKSFKLFKAIAKELFGKTILISVGGIDSPYEAIRRIKAGASLIQIYTAFIYKGPSLIKDINLALLQLLEKEGLNNISELVGVDIK
ncbi:MAG: quinone-dependent dihydroorotate dehydrogenase [Epsilonproteobacteria bacterium]|nr:quinone-dependent dihydroorotate dehydrogenase [Campylobacterota bacterium]